MMRQTKYFLTLILVLLVECSYSQNDKSFSYGSHNIVSKAILIDSCIIVAFNGQKLFSCFDLSFTKKWGFELNEGCSDFRFSSEDKTLSLLQVVSKTNRRYLHYNPFVDKLPRSMYEFELPDGLLSVKCLAQNRVLAFGETYLLIKDVFANRIVYNVTGKDWLQLSSFVENVDAIEGYISTNECDIACRVVIDSTISIADVSQDFRNMKWRTGSAFVIKDSTFAISNNKDGKRSYTFFENRDLNRRIGESKITGEMILEDFSLNRNLMVLNDPLKHRIVLTEVNRHKLLP